MEPEKNGRPVFESSEPSQYAPQDRKIVPQSRCVRIARIELRIRCQLQDRHCQRIVADTEIESLSHERQQDRRSEQEARRGDAFHGSCCPWFMFSLPNLPGTDLEAFALRQAVRVTATPLRTPAHQRPAAATPVFQQVPRCWCHC